jgi:small subunit ribosomal protein S15
MVVSGNSHITECAARLRLDRSKPIGRTAAGRIAREGITMALSGAPKKQLVTDYAIKDGDTGSPEVQVAIMTQRIRELTEHLKQHKHDFSSRRGLLMLAARRARLLKYLQNTDRERYLSLIQRLGLRK